MNDVKSILLREEGMSLKVYRCPAGKLTIGVGHKLETSWLPNRAQLIYDLSGKITESMALQILDEDIRRAREKAETLPWFHLLSENRQTVIICMIFQMGLEGVRDFKKMCEALAQGDNETAAKEMMDSKWAKHDSPDRAKRMAKMMREG
jgi:lysozyme